MKFQDLIIAFILVALFITLIFGFAINLSNEYEGEPMVSKEIDLTQIEEKLNESRSSSNAWVEAFTKGNVAIGFVLMITSFWGVVVLILSSIITFFAIITTIASNILHIPVIVTNTIAGILGIVLILLAWKLLKVGE